MSRRRFTSLARTISLAHFRAARDDPARALKLKLVSPLRQATSSSFLFTS